MINSNQDLLKNLEDLNSWDMLFKLHPHLGEPISKGKALPQEIIIKPEALDTSALQEGDGSKDYRPKTLDECIGQERTKEFILDTIKGCKENKEPFPHTILTAPAGHGKTLFGEIIANIMDKKIVKTTGGQIKSQQHLVDKIVEADGGVILVDEANRLKKEVGFFALPLMEQFELNGKRLKPFTMIFMTTHIGDLSKDLDALIERCDKLELEHYNTEQLITILKQYQMKQYPNANVPEYVFKHIAENARQTPRVARKFLRSFVYSHDLNRVLAQNRIVKEGLTDVDISVLSFLKINGASKNSIACHLKMKPQNYEYTIEPYLIYRGFVEVVNKRKLTEKGSKFLKGL